MLDREFKDRDYLLIQNFGTFLRQPVGARLGMNAGAEQRFIRIDVTDAPDERLI